MEPIFRDDTDDMGSNSPYKKGRPTSVLLDCKKRSCGNSCSRCTYCFFRIFYISVWFYWAPFCVPYISLIVPYLNDYYLPFREDNFKLYNDDVIQRVDDDSVFTYEEW